MKKSILETLFTKHRARIALFAVAALLPVAAFGKGSIISSPHNLSAGAAALGGFGKSGIAFSEEERICIFCHTPHNATPETPLWSHELSAQTYIPYESSTQHEKPGPGWAPTGASRLCLSCHDGTVAISSFRGSQITVSRFVTGRANLTHDLSDDHPISFSYFNAAASSPELAPIGALPTGVELEWGEYMQCSSCHDAHNNEFGNFLIMNNSNPDKPGYAPGSPLCTACHRNTGWGNSTHNPLLTPGLAFGCMNCHTVHAAPGPARLLLARKESDTCYLNCHNSAVAPSRDIKSLFDEPYRHPVGNLFDQPHDEGVEKASLPAVNYHVECVDCHNPHQVNHANVPVSIQFPPTLAEILAPPAVTGRLKGVTGINKDTRGIVVAAAEYEVCFRCHSGSNADKFLSTNKPNRMIANPDQIGRFARFNTTSFHPVTAPRIGTGASLLTSEMQTSMQMIYCSDCHNSDRSIKAGGLGPNGPHGSQYEHILMARYDMPLPASASPPYSTGSYPSSYDLCFRCHSDTFITGTQSGFRNGGTNEHVSHVQTRGIPCFACHDPHGVPGFPTTVSSHLINFDRTYTVDPATVPNPVYVPTVTGGSCTVKCHAVAGHIETYTR